MIAIITATMDSDLEKSFMTQVYMDYHRLMFAVANKLCAQPQESEDLVQNSLIRLMNHCAKLRSLDAPALAGYIVTTVRNTWYNQQLRDKVILPQWVGLNDSFDPLWEEREDFTAPIIERVDSEALLERVWARCTAEERFLLEGKYALGYTDQELARYLHCKPGSIRMKLTRVRRKAREVLNETEVSCHE